jgi:DNA-directed RNA polymerase subunit RPC12/RpoP
VSDRLSDLCSNCGAELEDEATVEERQPCPKCGSTARTKRVVIHDTVTMSSSLQVRLIRAWDSNSLTLAGVIFGIVVTVVGVVVATLGTLAAAIYAVIALTLLVVGLRWFAQPIIGWMRRILERATR